MAVSEASGRKVTGANVYYLGKWYPTWVKASDIRNREKAVNEYGQPHTKQLAGPGSNRALVSVNDLSSSMSQTLTWS
jgi:hypothetical protein